MSVFPTKRNEVLALAHTSSNGFIANQSIFQRPATDPTTIIADIPLYEAKFDQIVAAKAALKDLYDEADEIFDRINVGTKSNIKYGESIAKGDAQILALFNWLPPAPPSPLAAPGEPRALEIIGQGDGWVQIDWKEPSDGGAVASYVVQLSTDGAVNFKDVKAETDTKSILLNQPKAVPLVYQVVAINRAGTSAPSGIVKLVL